MPQAMCVLTMKASPRNTYTPNRTVRIPRGAPDKLGVRSRQDPATSGSLTERSAGFRILQGQSGRDTADIVLTLTFGNARGRSRITPTTASELRFCICSGGGI